MALFKHFRGNRASLDAQPLTDGYAYFCVDDGTFHIDYADADGALHRKQINAKDAETLTGVSLDELRNEFTSQDAVVLSEAQAYTDAAFANIPEPDLSNYVQKDGNKALSSNDFTDEYKNLIDNNPIENGSGINSIQFKNGNATGTSAVDVSKAEQVATMMEEYTEETFGEGVVVNKIVLHHVDFPSDSFDSNACIHFTNGSVISHGVSPLRYGFLTADGTEDIVGGPSEDGSVVVYEGEPLIVEDSYGNICYTADGELNYTLLGSGLVTLYKAQPEFSGAKGNHSVTAGIGTTANGEAEVVIGKYNKPIDSTLFSVGNGSESNPSNAFRVDSNGNAYVGNANDGIGNKVITQADVEALASAMLSVTYAELKDLRDSSNLKPGMFYRITDYRCTTTQEDTIAADHKFDIIVQALSTNTLSEEASADYHYNEDGFGDGYFRESTIFTKKNYTIDESVVDSGNTFISNAVTVEYHMYVDAGELYDNGMVEGNDEAHKLDVIYEYGFLPNNFGVEVPVLYKSDSEIYVDEGVDYQDAMFYDGKEEYDGVVYDRWRVIESFNDPDGSQYYWTSENKKYIFTNPIVIEEGEGEIIAIHQNRANVPAWKLRYCLDNDINRFVWASEDGYGVIYYMKDEYDNECPYDFKNIQFLRSASWHEEHPECFDGLNEDFRDDAYYYTFSWITEDNNIVDLTMQRLVDDQQSVCLIKKNTLAEVRYIYYPYPDSYVLPNNVFINSSDYDNGFFYGMYNNIIGLQCQENTLVCDCNANEFNTGCYGNILIASSCNYINHDVSNQLLDTVVNTEYV